MVFQDTPFNRKSFSKDNARPRIGVSSSLTRSLFFGTLAGLVVVFVAEILRIFVAGNVHAVIPGQAYRSSQLSPGDLQKVMQCKGIKTVINLRGCCATFDWYQDECRAVQQIDAVQEDVCLSSGRLPSSGEIRRLVEVIDRSTYPIIFHCHRGIDRTGLAAVMVLLLRTDLSFDKALEQLGIRFGHLNLGRTGQIDQFFELYRTWLIERQQEHSSDTFRDWACQEYRPANCLAKLVLLNPVPNVKPGLPSGLPLRATNVSPAPWEFRPNRLAGVHARFIIKDKRGRHVASGHAGLVEAVVPPGESIDLTVVLPALRSGHYSLIIDLEQSGHCLFFQAGSEPLEQELIVRE